MKRGAEGVFKDNNNWNTLSSPSMSNRAGASSGAGAESGESSPVEQQAAENLKTGADAWGDATTMDLAASPNDEPKAALNRMMGGASPPQPINGQGQITFFFNIGSIDSFERKLESSQIALGIPARRHIPVQYVSETR
jgi:AFG3 family protein